MDTRKPLTLQATGLMAFLCFIWAFQQVVLKATAVEISPTLQISLRSGVGAVLVWLFMVWRAEKMIWTDGVWRPGILVGLLFGMEFLLIGQGLNFTSASHMAVFLYTAPVFTALGLHLMIPSERLAPPQWLGIGLAFSGMALAFLGGDISGGDGAVDRDPSLASSMLWGDFLAVLAGFLWGVTTVVVRTTGLARLPATQTLLYQLVGACLLLLPAAWLLDDMLFAPTVLGWSSLAFQAVVVAFASYLAWFWMLRHYLASRLGALSFLTPLFGVVLGVWLLDEPLTMHFLWGSLLVILGIVLVSGYEGTRAVIAAGFRR
ncbi:MAG: DMT family transporter [Betaproteobacteria bacterium]|nr:DMT family transporter [Betaproteobacteria bacterium]